MPTEPQFHAAVLIKSPRDTLSHVQLTLSRVEEAEIGKRGDGRAGERMLDVK